ncbi:MAG: hypothetical protein PUD93_07460 [Lachnospiraceae bacterium]|nr:hypothetical protein [Lachnospiraceae bacterium]
MLTAEMKQAFNTGIESIKGDVVDMMTVALPAGLAIMGIKLALQFGISFFRSIAS